MIVIHILDIKVFMSKLLLKDNFDHFLVKDIEVLTGNYYQISGKRNPAWFSKEELELLDQANYSSWSELKSFVHQIMKGHKIPHLFKLVFLLPHNRIKFILQEEQCDYKVDDIAGLYINVRFEKGELHLVTATSMHAFSMDKTIEHIWEHYVMTLLKENEIACEIIA